MPVSSGYPLMIILLRGWICVASLRKWWPSANEIFILYRNKAQRVKQGALLKKSLSIHLTFMSFVFDSIPEFLCSQQYLAWSIILITWSIRLIPCQVQRLIFLHPPPYFLKPRKFGILVPDMDMLGIIVSLDFKQRSRWYHVDRWLSRMIL